jgi:DNA polymerase-3 subunit epsilon
MIVCVFDTETDGLINTLAVRLERQPEILSLYTQMVDLDNGTLGDVGNYLFKPSKPIPEDMTKIHGITNEMVKDAPPFRKLAPLIKQELSRPEMCIAHHATFDRDMINIEMQRAGIVMDWPRLICTVEQTIWLQSYRLSLTNLYKELFGLDFEEKHSASGDVTALTKCCIELRRREWL